MKVALSYRSQIADQGMIQTRSHITSAIHNRLNSTYLPCLRCRYLYVYGHDVYPVSIVKGCVLLERKKLYTSTHALIILSHSPGNIVLYRENRVIHKKRAGMSKCFCVNLFVTFFIIEALKGVCRKCVHQLYGRLTLN